MTANHKMRFSSLYSIVAVTTASMLQLQIQSTESYAGMGNFASGSTGEEGETPSDLRYARVNMNYVFPNGSTEQLHSISGVFSMYGVASDAEGVVVEASPLDL